MFLEAQYQNAGMRGSKSASADLPRLYSTALRNNVTHVFEGLLTIEPKPSMNVRALARPVTKRPFGVLAASVRKNIHLPAEFCRLQGIDTNTTACFLARHAH